MTDVLMPGEGSLAPAFSGVKQDGESVSLNDFKGRKLALYFYPRDNTSGCTKQACNLRDNYESLSDAGISVIGVSDDPIKSHIKFIDKHNLPFPLIADTERTILESFGVYGEKKMYGRTYMGTKRITFLIDEKGMITKILTKPKVGNHATEILEGFSN